jgi:hypothetical protein
MDFKNGISALSGIGTSVKSDLSSRNISNARTEVIVWMHPPLSSCGVIVF